MPAPPAEPGDEAIDPAALFANRDEGRSPLEWLGRLQKAAEAEAAPKAADASGVANRSAPIARPLVRAASTPSAAPGAVARPLVVPAQPLRALAPASAAQPVPQSARRFLQPLLGIDPAGVAVHRGAEATEAVAGLDADGATVGDHIIIGPEPENSPAGLGLLAHELTHVARARSPGFVPPVIARDAARPPATPHQPGTPAPRGADAPSRAAPDPRGDAPEIATAGELPPAPDQDDEAIALAVEHRVRQVAGDADASMSPPSPDAAAAPKQATRQPSRPARAWDGLPAPWEPMPAEARQTTAQAADAPTTPSPGRSPSPATAAAAGATPGVQRAARDRKLDPIAHAHDAGESSDEHQDEPEGGHRDETKTGSGGGSPADLDGLARQVYAVLRRRLAAERRRAG